MRQPFVAIFPDWLKSLKFSQAAAPDRISSLVRDKNSLRGRGKHREKICLSLSVIHRINREIPCPHNWRSTRQKVSCTGTHKYKSMLVNCLLSMGFFPLPFVVSLILRACLSRLSPKNSFFHPSQRTIVSILVDVSQRRYSRAKAAEYVRAGEGHRTSECQRGCLQVQVDPAHLSGLALHFSLHVEGRSHQHIISPADMHLKSVLRGGRKVLVMSGGRGNFALTRLR